LARRTLLSYNSWRYTDPMFTRTLPGDHPTTSRRSPTDKPNMDSKFAVDLGLPYTYYLIDGNKK
jgi:hypothetical protein